jgi:hypothetical protein
LQQHGRAALCGEGLKFFFRQVIGCDVRGAPGVPEHEVEHERGKGQVEAEQDGGDAFRGAGDGDLMEAEVRREQVRRGDGRGKGKERDEQQEYQVEAHEFRVGDLEEPSHVAVRDPHPADECEADEVAQVPGPLVFEPFDQRLVSAGYVEFYDEQRVAIAKTPSENASRRVVGSRCSWRFVSSAGAVVLTGVPPSFRRIDQLTLPP